MDKPAPSPDRPIFLIGSERSGTTMLRLMLDSHPDISFGYEFEYAVEKINDDGTRPALDDYYNHLETNRVFQSTGFPIDRTLAYDDLVRGFLDAQRGDSRLVGATIHFRLDRIPMLWPNARYIRIVRDPRDVSPSCVKMGWAGNVWFGLDKWLESEAEWETLRLSLQDDAVLEIRFEDLVSSHVEELRQLCQWIGVGYTDEMLDYVNWTSYDAPNPSAAQRWKKILTDEQVQLMEARLGDWLKLSGYEPSGLPPIDVDDKALNRLKWQDRARRIKYRVDNYGAFLTLAEMTTRPVGPNFLRNRFLRSINAIQTKSLKKSWR